MAELVLTDINEITLLRLQGRASRHGRSPVEEAKSILSEALEGKGSDAWASVDAIYQRLAESGRVFSDSADLLREDRDR